MRRAVILGLAVLAGAAFAFSSTEGSDVRAEEPQLEVAAERVDDDTCRLTGQVQARLGTSGEVSVDEECETTVSEEPVSPSMEPAGASLMAGLARVRGRVETSHFGIMMTRLDAAFTWGWDSGIVYVYTNPATIPNTGGCGWHVSDGPYSWWELGNMPSMIFRYAWAYFDTSCSPTMGGWTEVGPYGTNTGDYGNQCNYDINVPIGSSASCTSWLEPWG